MENLFIYKEAGYEQSYPASLQLLIPDFTRPVAHLELDGGAGHYLPVGEVGLIVRAAVDLDGLDVDVFFGDIGGQYGEYFAVRQVHLHFAEQRRPYFVLAAHGVYRVEAHRAHHVPSRHLATIFVAAQACRSIQV